MMIEMLVTVNPRISGLLVYRSGYSYSAKLCQFA